MSQHLDEHLRQPRQHMRPVAGLSPFHPLHLVLGLLVWFVWFSAVYGGLAVACAWVPPDGPSTVANALNAVALGVTLLVAALLLWAAWGTARAARSPAAAQPRQRFVAGLSAVLYAVAAASTLAVGLPLLVVPPCV
jgi:predicted transporter